LSFRSINSNTTSATNSRLPILSPSKMHRAIIFALIASAVAFPSQLTRRQDDPCPQTGSDCDDFEPICCDPDVGFASCDNGSVNFQSCSDGCGSLDGVVHVSITQIEMEVDIAREGVGGLVLGLNKDSQVFGELSLCWLCDDYITYLKRTLKD
jgi:hypothetical protein